MARIIGIDLSLRATGIAVKAGAAALYWDTCDAKGIGWKRLDAIVRWIVDDWIWPPNQDPFVVMEGLAFRSSMMGHSEIVGLSYIVRYKLWQAGIPCIQVNPMHLKKFVSGRGNAEKSMILREVYRRFGAIVSNDNEADAVVLAHIGMALLGTWEPQTAAQREVLEKVRLSNREQLENLNLPTAIPA